MSVRTDEPVSATLSTAQFWWLRKFIYFFFYFSFVIDNACLDCVNRNIYNCILPFLSNVKHTVFLKMLFDVPLGTYWERPCCIPNQPSRDVPWAQIRTSPGRHFGTSWGLQIRPLPEWSNRILRGRPGTLEWDLLAGSWQRMGNTLFC